MNRGLAAALFIGLLVLGAGAFIAAPALEDDARVVNEQARLQVERARRLLDDYTAQWDRIGLLLDELRLDYGVDTDISAPDELSENLGDVYEELRDETLAAHPPVNDKSRYSGDIARQMTEGVAARTELLEQNNRLLGDALAAVDEALRITRGSASSADNVEANRLKGVILYHMGVASQLEASMWRRKEAQPRRELVALTLDALVAQKNASLVEESEIGTRLSELNELADETQEVVDEIQAELTRIGTTIADLEGRLADARARADEARRGLERLASEGTDLISTGQTAEYARQYRQYSSDYDVAVREILALQSGTYTEASLEPYGDLLTGKYLGKDGQANLEIERGLNHYYSQRDAAQIRLQGSQESVEAIRADIARLEETQAQYEAKAQAARARVADAMSNATAVVSTLAELDSAAMSAEDSAIQSFDRSESAFRAANRSAESQASNARTEAGELSPSVRDFSAADARSKERWTSGFLAGQAADAILAKAWVLYSRYAGQSRNAQVLAEAERVFELEAMQSSVQLEQAADAQAEGIAAVVSAMKDLERAHGATNRHWTLVAQAAGANYLLSLFGEAGYEQEALAGYRSATSGRESEIYAAGIVRRMRELEQR